MEPLEESHFLPVQRILFSVAKNNFTLKGRTGWCGSFGVFFVYHAKIILHRPIPFIH